MTHNAETAWIALVLLILWAIATAIGASVGAIVARNRGSALTMIVGGVLGSAGGSAAPIAMGFCDRGDMGFWAIMTALLAAVGGYIGSTVAAPVGCGIVAVSFIGARSGFLSGSVVGTCIAGLWIVTERGHPIVIIYAPVVILMATAGATTYGLLFAFLFALARWIIRGPSPSSSGRLRGESPTK